MIEFVPANEIDAVFVETFGRALPAHGFEQVDRRRWVRSTKQPIRELVVMQALNGASFSLVWGFSLDFVPHVSGSELRWHRTAKTARFDLCYDPLDYPPEPGDWRVPTFDGRAAAHKALVRQSSWALELAQPWFDSVQSEVDLLREFEAKKQRPFIRFGFYNYVQAPLAYAVVLARAGRLAEAEAELEKYCEGGRVREAVKGRLYQLLEH